MSVDTGQQRRFPAVAIVLVLLSLCIFPGQFLMAKQFPAISGLVQINPSLMFLDIPVQIPVTIDMILVPGLFLLLYPVVILLFPSRAGIRRRPLERVRSAFAGLFVLLCCMVSGGLIFYLVQDHLSTQVKTGINSLGINADIHLAYPGFETIYLRGSMILLVCFFIGLFICIRKIRKEPPSQLTREQRMTPYERMLQEKRMQKTQMVQQIPKIQRPNNHAGVCYSQPVVTLKPEALYYMPM